MALTAKVRVSTQPLMASVWVTLMVTAPQASVAVTCVATLESVGRLAGLQPRSLPFGTVNVGAVESAIQVKTTLLEAKLVQASVAVTVKVRVSTQPLVASACVMPVVTALQV